MLIELHCAERYVIPKSLVYAYETFLITTGYMKRLLTSSVIFLTASLLSLSACSYLRQSPYQGECKTRAYVQFVLRDYLTKRFEKNARVRLGIIPFSAPANLSYKGAQSPGVGSDAAWETQKALLETGAVPIVEVFNRQDWPGKKEEFNTGNYGAIRYGREAGYDLVLVGDVEKMTNLDEVSVVVRLIETESGTTLYTARSTVYNTEAWSLLGNINLGFVNRNRVPSILRVNDLLNDLADCIVQGLLSEEPVPQ